MIHVDDTLISQYANSPILLQLIHDWDEAIDPRTDLADFVGNVWSIATAQSWGLDVWGRIVGVGRIIRVPGAPGDAFGFFESHGCQPFGQAPFYSPRSNFSALTLSDENYRDLILVKALVNISGCSTELLNRALQQLFHDYGRCYVHSVGDMRFHYVFEFVLPAMQKAILFSSGIVPRPAGVQVAYLECDPLTTFGFYGSDMQPFGQGTFSHGAVNGNT